LKASRGVPSSLDVGRIYDGMNGKELRGCPRFQLVRAQCVLRLFAVLRLFLNNPLLSRTR